MDSGLPPLIALVGAPGSGAEALAEALAVHIAPGVATLVPSTALLDALLSTASAHPASPVACKPTTDALAAALRLHQRAHLTLLMGLEGAAPLPPVTLAQETMDALLREALSGAGVAYRVVYGRGTQRVQHALKAINSIAVSAYSESARGTFDSKPLDPQAARLRAWNCEKCSDPECEHRLFTALIAPGAGAR